MTEQTEQKGIAVAILKLQEIYQLTEEQMAEIVGDSVYTALMQNNYNFVTIGDMQKIADALGLVFVMNFQTIDVYLGAGENTDEQ